MQRKPGAAEGCSTVPAHQLFRLEQHFVFLEFAFAFFGTDVDADFALCAAQRRGERNGEGDGDGRKAFEARGGGMERPLAILGGFGGKGFAGMDHASRACKAFRAGIALWPLRAGSPVAPAASIFTFTATCEPVGPLDR